MTFVSCSEQGPDKGQAWLAAASAPFYQLPAAAPTVQTAATTLAQIVGQIVQSGATHVVVVNLPNVGLSPEGLASSDGGANLTQLSQLFNDTLNSALQTNGVQSKVIRVDAFTWLNQIIANFQANGFAVSNTAVACDRRRRPIKRHCCVRP